MSKVPIEPAVSVIITCYNYGAFVTDAIKSVQSQTLTNLECLIIDDGSTDNSREVISQAIEHDLRFTLIEQSNHGVAHARNTGLKLARSDKITFLDADDMIAPTFLEVCATALDQERDLAIAFTGITIMGSDHVNGWPNGYDFDLQVEGKNQVPSCNMLKKKFLIRVGGYKQRYAPAEDARAWLDIGSIGGKAKQVSQEGLFIYRVHSNSQSRIKPQKDWHSDKSWARNGQRPFAADGKPRLYSWPVRDFDRPLVSIIIPVGPKHEALVYDALDSVEAQTDTRWEVILINDTGHELQLTPYPYVRLLNTGGTRGASIARNMGIQAAHGSFVVFLDSDDVLYPTFLRQTLAAYEKTGYYAYTDWDMITLEGKKETHECPEFTPQRIFEQGYFHPITCLIPTEWLRDISGFDDTMETWEDVDLFMNLISKGYCGTRVAEPLMLYRYTTGSLREKGYAKVDELKAFFKERYQEYIVGGKQVVCCGTYPTKTNGIVKGTPEDPTAKFGAMVLIEYISKMQAPHPVIGSASKQNYGSRMNGDTFYVYQKDIDANPQAFVAVQVISAPTAKRIAPPEPRLLHRNLHDPA